MFDTVVSAVFAMVIIFLWSASLIVGTAGFISNRLTNQSFCQWLWDMFHATMDDEGDE